MSETKLDDLRKMITAQDKIAAVNVATVTGKLDAAAASRDEMKKEIKEIKKTVNGNSGPGLVGRMTVIEKAIEKWKDTQTWLVRLVISGVVLGIIGVVINYFV